MLGSASEAITRFPATVWVRGASHALVTTPARPDFHFGNRLWIDEPVTPEALPAWLARWKDRLGGLGLERTVLSWAVPEPLDDRARDALRDAGAPHGLELEHDVTLVLGDPVLAALPAGVGCRQVAGADWDALGTLTATVHPDRVDFSAWQRSQYRLMVEAGRGEWWLCRAGDLPVGGAGIFWGVAGDRGVTRFQQVAVHPDHRRRGVCTGLIATMAADARRRRPDDAVVIVAQPGSQAERIYRRVGFRPDSAMCTLIGTALG